MEPNGSSPSHSGNGNGKKPKKRARKHSAVIAVKVVTSLKNNGGNKSAAARELGVTPQNIQKHVDQNPLVRKGLDDYLEALKKEGVTDKKSARVISEAMDAERTVSVEDDREGAKGPRGGQAYTKITEPDHPTRLKANEQYVRIKKLLNNSDPDEGDNKRPLVIMIGVSGQPSVPGQYDELI